MEFKDYTEKSQKIWDDFHKLRNVYISSNTDLKVGDIVTYENYEKEIHKGIITRLEMVSYNGEIKANVRYLTPVKGDRDGFSDFPIESLTKLLEN